MTLYLNFCMPRLKGLFLALSYLMFLVHSAAAQGKVTPLPGGAGWRIERPDVTKAIEEFSAIRFQKFDEVRVTGGGCLQTGGSGKTWKRYVDPSGENSDRLYHGRIWIPGATDGLVRISSIAGVPLMVNFTPSHVPESEQQAQVYLRLGYEDDKYSDNNYNLKKHDDGTSNQCALSADPGTDGTAWLEIRLTHHDTAQVPPEPRAPLDLWWNHVDDNLVPVNPEWWIHKNLGILPNTNTKEDDKHQFCDQFREGPGDQLLKAKDPLCTMSDPDVDEANILSSFCHIVGLFANSVHGHVNWGPATYTGQIYFDRSNNFHPQGTPAAANITVAGDGDYDWLLATPNGAGTAEGNKRDSERSANEKNLPSKDTLTLALEFSTRETIDKMDKSKTWKALHDDIDHDPLAAVNRIKGKEAIVIGLLGFDNEHANEAGGARVELHPVWGLAIRVSEGPAEDVWLVMARNWGNEGSCSNGFDVTHGKWQHNLRTPQNKLRFFFPVSGSHPTYTADFHANYGNPIKDKLFDVDTTSFGDGVLLTINLPEPEKKKLFWGELHIQR